MISKRVAKFNPLICVACGACAKKCPHGAILIHKGCYAAGNAELCIGCGRCANICPCGCIEIIKRQENDESK